jgi:integrase
MANTQVTLIWRCKTEAGWRQFKAVMGANGRPKKGVVMDGDPPQEVQYPQGSFQLRYYEGNKMIYKNVGPDTGKALDEKYKLENLLKTRVTAVEAGVQIVEDPRRKTLATAYEAFLQSADDRGSDEAKIVYRTALDEFFQVINRTYVDELTMEDMLQYQRHLRKRGCSDRTIFNRWSNVKAFFLYCGFDPKKMPSEDGEKRKLKAPKYEEQTPEIYEPEEMGEIFKFMESDAAIESDPGLYACCQIMLKCGLRDQEACYLEWRNVNLNSGILSVRGNPRYDFKVKDSEQRDIPMPKSLVRWLRSYREARPQDLLVCPTVTGLPNTKHLRLLKSAAFRAGLNCNSCPTCVEKNECERWFLHKFRATAITMWLRPKEMGGAGLDLRTVMKLSGHADLASVMRYLSPASDEAVRKGVDAVTWGD